jgi:hypothetical protein
MDIYLEEKEKVFNRICVRYQDSIHHFNSDFQIIDKVYEECLSSFDDSAIYHLQDTLLQKAAQLSNCLFQPQVSESVNLIDLVDGSLKLLTRRMRQDGIKIRKNIRQPFIVQGDPLVLWFMIYNMVRISLTRCSKEGTLSLGIREKEGDIEIVVRDNGYAFDESRVFSFSAAHSGRSPFLLDLSSLIEIAESFEGRMETTLSNQENTIVLVFPKERPDQTKQHHHDNVIHLFDRRKR